MYTEATHSKRMIAVTSELERQLSTLRRRVRKLTLKQKWRRSPDEAATALAKQLEQAPDTAAAVTLGYQTVLGPAPTAKEQKSISAFIGAQQKSYPNNGRQLALADFAQVLFGLNEFIYVE